jgi:hypothetical protein
VALGIEKMQSVAEGTLVGRVDARGRRRGPRPSPAKRSRGGDTASHQGEPAMIGQVLEGEPKP